MKLDSIFRDRRADDMFASLQEIEHWWTISAKPWIDVQEAEIVDDLIDRNKDASRRALSAGINSDAGNEIFETALSLDKAVTLALKAQVAALRALATEPIKRA